MLLIKLHPGESLRIGDAEIVFVDRSTRGAGFHARLGITAPKDMKIEHRAGRGSGARASFTANINTGDIMQSGYSTAMDGYTKQAGIFTNLYNGQLSAWNAQNNAASQSNSDLMGALGYGAGLFFKSDENAKENKEPATGSLKAVRSMPVQEWDYKPGQGDGGRHIGTYAQDFKAATGKGDGHSIPVIDAIGVTMGAVKELDAKVEKLAKGMPAYDRSCREQPALWRPKLHRGSRENRRSHPRAASQHRHRRRIAARQSRRIAEGRRRWLRVALFVSVARSRSGLPHRARSFRSRAG